MTVDAERQTVRIVPESEVRVKQSREQLERVREAKRRALASLKLTKRAARLSWIALGVSLASWIAATFALIYKW